MSYPHPVSRRLTRHFWRHYAEMVAVMLVGMAVLAIPAQLATDALWPSVDGDDTTLMLGRMAVTMAVPMVPWMRWRGHGWLPCLEMAAAMIVPGIGAIALLEAGILEDAGALMVIEHVVMLIAMFAVMVARPREYSHHHGPARAATSGA